MFLFFVSLKFLEPSRCLNPKHIPLLMILMFVVVPSVPINHKNMNTLFYVPAVVS